MKKIFKITLCVLCMSLLIPMVALAESGGEGIGIIYYVATNGNDSNPGTEAQPWLTIQKAADTMTAGNTVYIKEGVYNEQVIPQNSGTLGNYITYAAYPGDTVIIDGDGISLPPDFFSGLFNVSDKSYVKISGLKIINAGYTTGIMVCCSSYIIVEKNYTYNTVSSGIGVWWSNNIIIDNNEVELACNDGTQECITIAVTDTFEVKNNHVHDAGPGTYGGEGIDVKDGSSNGKVYNNFVHHVNDIGIYVDAWDKHTYNIEVSKNVVSDNISGIVVASEQGGLLEDIKIHNNITCNNVEVGIWIAGWSGAPDRPMRNVGIINNTIYNNGNDWGGGILVANPDAENVIIRNNICSQNLSFQIAVEYDVPEQNLTVDYNLIDGYRGWIWDAKERYGSDYVEGDPMFVNPSQADFHLQENSPAIDNGLYLDAPEDDFDGNRRPEGIDHDMGTYEFVFNVPGNIPPTADAGPDVTVDEGEEVPLDGLGSSDPDDGIVAYFWEQTGGPEVDILDPTDVQTSFIAPDLASEGVSLTFKLTVQDSGGLIASDTCVVNVTWMNTPPTADAGQDQTVFEGDTATLDGSASMDPDDGIAFIRWTQTSGTPVALSDPAALQPKFIAPEVGGEGETLIFQLTVTDMAGLASQDTCVVIVNPTAQILPPTADIKANGLDGTVTVRRRSSVSISISIDPGDLKGETADLWLVADAPWGRFFYVYGNGWQVNSTPFIQYPLDELISYEVFNTRLPRGDYFFHFAIDDNADGIPDGTWLDTVSVKVR